MDACRFYSLWNKAGKAIPVTARVQGRPSIRLANGEVFDSIHTEGVDGAS